MHSESEDGVAPSTSEVELLYYAAIRYFGSWSNACEEAGLTPKKSKKRHRSKSRNNSEKSPRKNNSWTKEQLLETINDFAKGNTAPPISKYPFLIQAASKFFDSWEACCEEAGLTPRPASKGWSREMVIEELRENASDGVAPRAIDHSYLAKKARLLIGSWKEACSEAGLQTAAEALKWTKEDVLDEIRRLSEDHIAPPTNAHSSLATYARKFFGSWEKACKKADVKSRSARRNRWSRDKVIEELRNRSDDGVAPSSEEAENLQLAAYRYFDSWKAACEEAGLQSRSEASKWSKEDVIEAIRESSEDGVAPATTNKKRLYAAVKQYFDSWAEACHEAGVTPKSKA